MSHTLTITFRLSPELKAKLGRLADAEGERMVSEGEMLRRLIERGDTSGLYKALSALYEEGCKQDRAAITNGFHACLADACDALSGVHRHGQQKPRAKPATRQRKLGLEKFGGSE